MHDLLRTVLKVRVEQKKNNVDGELSIIDSVAVQNFD